MFLLLTPREIRSIVEIHDSPSPCLRTPSKPSSSLPSPACVTLFGSLLFWFILRPKFGLCETKKERKKNVSSLSAACTRFRSSFSAFSYSFRSSDFTFILTDVTCDSYGRRSSVLFITKSLNLNPFHFVRRCVVFPSFSFFSSWRFSIWLGYI
jgi:hypothetical protein